MITKPTPDYVASRLPTFDSNPRYRDADYTVQLVFSQWPQNVRIEEVLAKVVILNRLYSTNIFDVYTVTTHIHGLNIDQRLSDGDLGLVNDIANVELGQKPRFNYSFATKYCGWHRPNTYQIFDSQVEKLLWLYQQAFNFGEFNKSDLRQYERFIDVVDTMMHYFKLERFSRKEIDRFLWIEARS